MSVSFAENNFVKISKKNSQTHAGVLRFNDMQRASLLLNDNDTDTVPIMMKSLKSSSKQCESTRQHINAETLQPLENPYVSFIFFTKKVRKF
jgi:hypothetical protein